MSASLSLLRTSSRLKLTFSSLSLLNRVTEERQKEMHSAISEAVSDMPIVVLARLVAHQVRSTHSTPLLNRVLTDRFFSLPFSIQIFGLPLYLILNASGQKHYAKHVDHYLPSSPIFKSRDFWDIIWSDIGIASVIGTMVYWANVRSWQEMVSMVRRLCFVFVSLSLLPLDVLMAFILYSFTVDDPLHARQRVSSESSNARGEGVEPRR